MVGIPFRSAPFISGVVKVERFVER